MRALHTVLKPHLIWRWADTIAHCPGIVNVVSEFLGDDVLVWSMDVFKRSPENLHRHAMAPESADQVAPVGLDWHQDSLYLGLQHGVRGLEVRQCDVVHDECVELGLFGDRSTAAHEHAQAFQLRILDQLTNPGDDLVGRRRAARAGLIRIETLRLQLLEGVQHQQDVALAPGADGTAKPVGRIPEELERYLVEI